MCGDLESLKNAQIRYQKKLKQEMKKKEKKDNRKKKRKRNEYHAENDDDALKENENEFIESPLTKRQKKDPNYLETKEKGTKQERTVFVVNLRKTMNREDINEVFARYGKIQSIKLPKDPKAKHRSKLKGIGYIEYKHKDDAMKCIKELNNKSVQGKVLRIERYRDRNDVNDTVFIRGLSGLNEVECNHCIKTILKECGEIKEIRLTREKYGNGHKIKGFGYVQFMKHESVELALKCDKAEYKNKIIEIKPYKTDEEREKNDKNKNKYKDKMDVDHHEMNEVSSDFVPRSIGKRKSKLKQNKQQNDGNKNYEKKEYDQKILNKSNKTQNDFRKLFGI